MDYLHIPFTLNAKDVVRDTFAPMISRKDMEIWDSTLNLDGVVYSGLLHFYDADRRCYDMHEQQARTQIHAFEKWITTNPFSLFGAFQFGFVLICILISGGVYGSFL